VSPVEVLMEALNICGQEGYFEQADISAAYDWLKEQSDGG
jgi:hypothetical protein